MVETTAPMSMGRVLSVFYAEGPFLRHPALRRRAERVRDHLTVFLDTEAERWLLPDELALVEAERQLDPAGAVARVTGAAALVSVLPGFLDEAWLLTDPSDAAVQVELVTSLAAWMVQRDFVDAREMEVALLEVAAKVEAARAALALRYRA